MSIKFSTPHSRYNPLINEWVLLSPQKTNRSLETEKRGLNESLKANYDSNCSFCPGNSRPKGEQNPPYLKTFSFLEDYPALLPESVNQYEKEDHLFKAHSERGICKTLCYSPHHCQTMATLGVSRIENIIKKWIEEWMEMREIDFLNHIQIFEENGETGKEKNPHPRCRIWGLETIPNIPQKEGKQQWLYFEEYGSCLLCIYLKDELKKRERIVFENDHFVSLVPYWAGTPFETILIPKNHAGSFETLDTDQKFSFAKALSETAIRYDNLFQKPISYTMGIHQEPVTSDDENYPHWHWHIHFMPNSSELGSSVKSSEGYEVFCSPQQNITPEEAAWQLREVSKIHYSKNEF